MIYEKDRHETITNSKWDKQKVEDTLRDIFDKTCSALTDSLWPPHPDEDSKASVNKSLYFGATGTLWGLNFLAHKRGYKLPFSEADLIEKIHRMYKEEPDTESVCPSYYLGEVGIQLLNYKITKNEKVVEQLYNLIESNRENPCVDALWGCPGTMLPALFLHHETGEERFVDLYKRNVDFLFDVWKHHSETDAWYWEYKQGDKVIPFIGSGHGFFGNVFPLLKGIEFLSEEQKETLFSRTLETTKKFATEVEGAVNWPATFFDKGNDAFRVQWCHGSPGMIQSLELIPQNKDEDLEILFLQAGELIWRAGPLKKGIGICHGTDGNGISFLKLFQRTNDEKWLERAQQFAMHSIETRNHRHTLWTGELGLACFLQGCLDREGFFPGLDFF